MDDIPCVDASLTNALSVATVEILFAGAANGASGVVLSPVSGQAGAAVRAFLAIGGSAAATSALMSLAQAKGVVGSPGYGAVIPPFVTLEAELVDIATGLKNYMADVAAITADAAWGIAFAIGGIDVKSVLEVEVEVYQSVAASKARLPWKTFTVASNTVLPVPVKLGANSKWTTDGTTEISAASSNPLVVIPSRRVIAGLLNIGEFDNIPTIEASGLVILRLRVKV